jgi:indolepyruvate ferredoxin oxidoreductase
MLSPERTTSIVSADSTPTAQEVVSPATVAPDVDALLRRIASASRPPLLSLPATPLAERLFGDHMMANSLLLGAAFQVGALPVSLGALTRAVELNGVQVPTNLAAVAWGRALAHDPELIEQLLDNRRRLEAPPAAADPRDSASIEAAAAGSEELRNVLEVRTANLRAHSGQRAAERYLGVVAEVAERERAVTGSTGGLATSVARRLHDLMAYKDEYEVARLHLLSGERARVLDEVGPAKVYWNLHPPVLRSLGLRRKLRFGPWFGVVLKLLAAAKPLRGTPFDPFGYARVRCVERSLVDEYCELILGLTQAGDERSLALAQRASELTDGIRGYEDIKLRSVEEYRTQLRDLLQLDAQTV